MSEINADVLAKLYKSGLSLRQVAIQTGLSADAVRSRLHSAGVEIRSVGRPDRRSTRICITLSPGGIAILDELAAGSSRSAVVERLLTSSTSRTA